MIYRVALAILLAQPALLQPGDKAAGKVQPDPNVHVQLRLSVETLDPLKPGDAYVECTIQNKSGKAVTIPTRYTGGYRAEVALMAQGEGAQFRHELRMVYWAGPEKQEHKQLGPGEEATIFKALLKDVLQLQQVKPEWPMPNKPRYYWAWQA
jgi:hypothetical protein